MVEAPSSVTVENIDGDQIKISWTDVATDEDGYRVYVSRNGLNWTQDSGDIAAGTTSYKTSNLLDGEKYHLRVVAYKGNEESGDSTNTRNYGSGTYGGGSYITYDP